jgi:hypothetical protein
LSSALGVWAGVGSCVGLGAVDAGGALEAGVGAAVGSAEGLVPLAPQAARKAATPASVDPAASAPVTGC